MRNIATTLLLLIALYSQAQTGTWTWMHGATNNGTASFGVQGLAAATNLPPAVSQTANWTDLEGNFWFFGGRGSAGLDRCALWRYSPQTNMWTWVNGPSGTNTGGNFGTKGVPSATNRPGSRSGNPSCWVDAAGDLWMFGGWGSSINSSGRLNDLWRYNIATNLWTWMAGDNTYGGSSVGGVVGQESPTFTPGRVNENKVSWVDNAGNFWIYGGLESCGTQNDIWRYNTTTNMWARMYGGACNLTPVYGTLGVEAPTNTPGSRMGYCSYYDRSTGCLWVFGGMNNITDDDVYNDVWRYNPTTNKWTWMAGTQTINSGGTYTSYCEVNNFMPRARYGNTATWSDDCGHIWSYGGADAGTFNVLSDFWMFDINTLKFTWIHGQSSASGYYGSYGVKGVPAATNRPAQTMFAAAFKDNNGDFWMFGDYVPLNSAMWRYSPNAFCGLTETTVPALTFTPQPSTACLPYAVNFNSNYTTPTAKYSWNFGDAGNADTSHLATPSYTYTQEGTYTATLIVTDSIDGCNISSGTLQINIIVAGAADIPDTSICNNTILTIGDTVSGFTYLWNNNQVTPTINVSSGGIYWVQLSNGSCTYTDTINVTPITIPDIAISDTTICANDTILLNAYVAGAGYNWSTGDTSAAISVMGPMDITVDVTLDGCSAQFSISVDTISCETGILHTQADKKTFIIYPNPATDNFTIFLPHMPVKPYPVNVYSADGKMILSTTTKGRQFTIDTRGWKSGNYFVSVNYDNTNSTQTITITQ